MDECKCIFIVGKNKNISPLFIAAIEILNIYTETTAKVSHLHLLFTEYVRKSQIHPMASMQNVHNYNQNIAFFSLCHIRLKLSIPYEIYAKEFLPIFSLLLSLLLKIAQAFHNYGSIIKYQRNVITHIQSIQLYNDMFTIWQKKKHERRERDKRNKRQYGGLMLMMSFTHMLSVNLISSEAFSMES